MSSVSQLMLGRISKEEFLTINSITDIAAEIERWLSMAYQNQNADEVDEGIYLLFVFELFDVRYVDILHRLLLSTWHYKHEDIVILLERISSLKSLDYLYDAIDLCPLYLKDEDNYVFEVKCVRAIYYIGKDKAYTYLEKLCLHENEVVREMAKRQIEKIQ